MGNITDYIPENTAVLIQLNNPDQFTNDLRNNAFLKANNSFPPLKNLNQRLSAFNYFSHKKPALLAFSSENENHISYTYISEGIPEIKNLDSIPNRKVETTKAEFGEIKSFTFEDYTTHTTQIDSFFIASDSKKILEELLENKNRKITNHSADLEKALRAASDRNPTVFISHENISEIFLNMLPEGSASFLNNFSNWTALDTEVNQNMIKLDGITTATDTLPKFINLFEDVNPARNDLASVTPGGASGFLSYAFQDFRNLETNLLKQNSKQPSENNTSKEKTLLENASEIGVIYTEEGNIFAVRSIGSEPLESFAAGSNLAEEFRSIEIYGYEDAQIFQALLKPIISTGNLKYSAQVDNFLLFSEGIEPLKETIAEIQNKNTFAENPAYLSASENLSTEASVLWVSRNGNFKTFLADKVSEENRSATKDISVDEFPFTAFQLIYNSNFAHVHAILEKNEQKLSSAGVQQTATVTLESPVAGPPVFIKNHRTKGMDVAVQDTDNNLYLISESGNIYWKKQLESRILGSIQQVDIFRNGRIQLVFATPHKLQVIDREGNEVKPFPLEFNDEITQPLALFDYDNNRKYRFVVTQGREVLMYDRKGARVKGFGFTKAADRISQQPKHIRMGNKDYIVIPETTGKINILDRRGNVRVPVKEQLDLSGNHLYEYNNNFTSTSKNGELIKITQNGNISKEALGLGENHAIDATAKTLVTLSDNQLSIKGNTVELDFGLYTEPEIFVLNNKLYIQVTDTQAKRVFLFDSNGALLPGFPVYGTSVIDLNNIDGDRNLEFVVKGEDDTLLLYEVKE
ncbi:hypothetical protein GCM10007103_34720 [Salinimicrobium marinum]|uniref:Uncharacterized protein n=2 Tax=Salinimicrobium marinum TaxID=680283 RepID=A0A918SMZ8_9FLAO|nr:hypothetical protein GCM10007103_34720 [Salinimicrobium marinum]